MRGLLLYDCAVLCVFMSVQQIVDYVPSLLEVSDSNEAPPKDQQDFTVEVKNLDGDYQEGPPVIKTWVRMCP